VYLRMKSARRDSWKGVKVPNFTPHRLNPLNEAQPSVNSQSEITLKGMPSSANSRSWVTISISLNPFRSTNGMYRKDNPTELMSSIFQCFLSLATRATSPPSLALYLMCFRLSEGDLVEGGGVKALETSVLRIRGIILREKSDSRLAAFGYQHRQSRFGFNERLREPGFHKFAWPSRMNLRGRESCHHP
jgi:hypothetical protein